MRVCSLVCRLVRLLVRVFVRLSVFVFDCVLVSLCACCVVLCCVGLFVGVSGCSFV